MKNSIQIQPLDYAQRSCTTPEEEPLWKTIVGALALVFNISLIFLIILGLSA